MKKLTCLLTLLTLSTPSFAYDARHETYAGFRIHKNENIAFEYDVHGASDTTLRRDNFGIGGIIGKIVSIKEETCVIETSHERTKIRILKSAVSRVDVKAEDAE